MVVEIKWELIFVKVLEMSSCKHSMCLLHKIKYKWYPVDMYADTTEMEVNRAIPVFAVIFQCLGASHTERKLTKDRYIRAYLNV